CSPTSRSPRPSGPAPLPSPRSSSARRGRSPRATPKLGRVPEELRIASRPTLEHPILIAAFRGWNDGGQGASLATGYLAKLWEAKRFAEIDPENFFDFQATRPHVSLEEGLTRRIDWSSTVFYH